MAPTPGLGWIMAANVVIAVDYSMIMPTGFEYIDEMGGSSIFYGSTIACFPIGRICLLMLIGYWSDKSGFRVPFRVANLLGICGGLLYGSASGFGSIWLAVAGRFVGGCGATHPLSAWASRAYPPDQRVVIESKQKAAQLMGVVLGPALNALFVSLDVNYGYLQLNPRTMAGYFPAFLNLVLLVGFTFGVQEPPKSSVSSVADGNPFRRLMTSGAWLCMFSAFHTNVQVSAIDTIIAPLTAQHWGWNLLQNSMMFAGLAFVSASGAIAGIIAKKRGVATLKLIFVGSIMNLIASSVQAITLIHAPDDIPMNAFLLSGACVILGVLLYAGPTGGLYQQACGNSQGLLGGLYTMAFALGRPVGALLGGNLLQSDPLPLCIALVAFVFFSIVFQMFLWRRLEKVEEEALLSVKIEAPLIDAREVPLRLTSGAAM